MGKFKSMASAPMDGTEIIIRDEFYGESLARYHEESGEWLDGDGLVLSPTMWRPTEAFPKLQAFAFAVAVLVLVFLLSQCDESGSDARKPSALNGWLLPSSSNINK